MNLEMRPIDPEEFPRFHRAANIAFGETATEAEVEAERGTFEFGRSLGVFDGAEIVATAGAYTFQLTLPGLGQVPAGGVSYVTVLPTHRRRGILTSIMRRQFSDFADRGEPVAILTASESNIYGRFGFGCATEVLRVRIDTRHSAFDRAVQAPGHLRMLDAEEARSVLPGVYDRMRTAQPGALDRSTAYWDSLMIDLESRRGGMSARVYVAYEPEPGVRDGYVMYRVKSDWEGGLANYSVNVQDLVALTPEARTALWRYCLDMDLVTNVVARHRPVDEPLRWMLADPRRMEVLRYNDFLWLRLLDIEKSLAARRYGAADRLVFAVSDRFCPDNAGGYSLETGDDGALCERVSDDADIALDVSDLSAAYLGGVRFTTLAQAGRAVELNPGALLRADTMFASNPAPWCCTGF